jgi:protein phosphatase-4 regulatory subunit 3
LILTHAAARAHLDDFLSHFYEKHITSLSGYIGSFVAEEEATKEAAVRVSRATTFSYVIEALCDFVKTHNFRLKHCIMQHKIMARVAALCAHPQKHVVLCALRFIKTCIFRCPNRPARSHHAHPSVYSDDKFYETHVIKFDILDPIMRVFARCSTRNNLVASCILDLFERLRKDSSLHKALIEHLCTRHADALRASDVGCVKQLLERYEQQCEHNGSGCASIDANSAGRLPVHAAPKVVRTSLHRAGRDIGDDDESYFDRDTEEDSGEFLPLRAACAPPNAAPQVPWPHLQPTTMLPTLPSRHLASCRSRPSSLRR